MNVKIAPSLMCANMLELRRDIAELERAKVDMFHIDIMDGHFVPNLALSFELADAVAHCTSVPLDLHLMVERPENYVEAVGRLRPGFVSFHIEATPNPIRLTRVLKDAGTKVGIALNPSTSAASLSHVIDEVDYVLLLTVEPGFAGQKFIPQVLKKVRAVREMLDASGEGKELQVDGNMNVEWSTRCIANGASIVVAGTSSVFNGSSNLYGACESFRNQIRRVMYQPAESGGKSPQGVA